MTNQEQKIIELEVEIDVLKIQLERQTNINKKQAKQLDLHGVVKSLKDEDIPTFDEYTQNYGYKRIGNSNVYKNEGTYKDTETLLKEYKKEYCL